MGDTTSVPRRGPQDTGFAMGRWKTVRISVLGILSVFLVVLNLAVFAKVHTTPILWQQGEFGQYNWDWSAQWEGRDQGLLESGWHGTCLLKIFSSDAIYEASRSRPFAYLIEMLTLKFKQSLEIVSFRSFSAIAFHVINCLLSFFIIYRLTHSWRPSLLTALLILNSGIAVTTVLFPFWNAKFLITLLVLAGWWGVLPPEGRFLSASPRRLAAFVFVCALALFTDELAQLMLPMLLFWAYSPHPLSSKERKRFVWIVLSVLSVFLLGRSLIKVVQAQFHQVEVPNLLGVYLSWLMDCYQSPLRVFIDAGYAFGGHFLRSNFGSWDLSFWGMMAAFSFAGLVVLAVRSFKQGLGKYMAALVLTILLQVLMFIDNPQLAANQHFFPSMFFYHYYYTYPASVLAVMVLGLSLSRIVAAKDSVFVLAMVLVTVIGVSNYRHRFELVQQPLNIHGYHHCHRRAIPHILKMKEVLPQLGGGPVYLSFPSGSREVFQRRVGAKSMWDIDPSGERQELHPDFVSYASLIPVNYLRALERGELIMALKNVVRADGVRGTDELRGAAWFYDVAQEQWFNLERVKRTALRGQWSPVTINGPVFTAQAAVPAVDHALRCLVLVKGAAKITFVQSNLKRVFHQRYGYAWQVFHFIVPPNNDGSSRYLDLTVEPKTDHPPVQMLGPFFMEADEGHFVPEGIPAAQRDQNQP